MPKDSNLEELLIINTLSRIDGKLDKLDDRMDGMGTLMTRQQGILDEHVRRTNLLELKIEEDKRIIASALEKKAEEAVRTERNKLIVGALKVGGVVAGIGGGGLGLKELLPHLIKLFGG